MTRLIRFEVAEDSMEPTLSDGDWVIGIRSPSRVHRGDIVVVDHPERTGFELVKRVTAIAGDTPPDHPEITLLPGEIWVIGDNPDVESVDSAAFGPLLATDVTARIAVRYRPLPPSILR